MGGAPGREGNETRRRRAEKSEHWLQCQHCEFQALAAGALCVPDPLVVLFHVLCLHSPSLPALRVTCLLRGVGTVLPPPRWGQGPADRRRTSDPNQRRRRHLTATHSTEADEKPQTQSNARVSAQASRAMHAVQWRATGADRVLSSDHSSCAVLCGVRRESARAVPCFSGSAR